MIWAPDCLAGKTALVTGASSGLGSHFAQVLANAGAKVLLAARRQQPLSDLAAQIRASGGGCETLLVDLSINSDFSAFVAGLEPIDILVNNAGLVREAAALDARLDDWNAVLDTNLRAMFFYPSRWRFKCGRAALGGSIVNVASILGLRQAGGIASYAVSKAGVIQLTKALALELARFGIRVNALAPGYINTELNNAFWSEDAGKALIRRIPQRRLGELTDLDGPLLMLASDASSYMTGAVIAVDGGHLVSSL